MLERADEDHGALGGGDVRAKRPARVEVGREAQVEHVDELVDRPCRAGAAEDHAVVLGRAPDRVQDDPPRILAKTGGLEAGAGGLRVGVRVEGHDLLTNEVLDEAQRAPAGRVVGIRHAPRTEGAVEHGVVADDPSADGLYESTAGGQVLISVHGTQS